jgi:hypothetical protein
VQVHDRLSGAQPGVGGHAIVLQTRIPRNLGDELEHALGLVGGQLADVPERLDVPLGDDEQVRLGLRRDVPDRDEPVRLGDMVAVADELAEEAVVRQRGSPPP